MDKSDWRNQFEKRSHEWVQSSGLLLKSKFKLPIFWYFSLNNKLPQHFPLVLFVVRTCQIDKEVSNKVQSQNWPSKDPKVIGCLCFRSKSSLDLPLNKESAVISCFFLLCYCISSNCFHGNYSFLKVENVEIFIYIVSALCNFLLHNAETIWKFSHFLLSKKNSFRGINLRKYSSITEKTGNYSRLLV